MAYQNYSGAWLAQTNSSFQWLANEWQQITPQSGVDTAKIWQSYTLSSHSPMNNLIVFGDGSYAAGNAANNVLVAENSRNLLYGGHGEDVLVGSGGSGTTFIIAMGEGNKVIQNFNTADTLRLIGGPLTSFDAVKSAMTQQGSDVILNDGGTMIAFRNTTVGQFQADDFQLPLNYAALGTPTFREEFDNPSTIGTNWDTNFGYAGDGRNSFTLPNNAEQQIYTSADFKGTAGAPLGLNPYIFNNGVLSLKAQPVNDWQSSQMWGYKYSSGMLYSEHAQTYGYFEMRAELPKGDGLWPAFWLIGEQNREIDVLEGLGSDTKVAYNALHSHAVPAIGNASFNPYPDGFHTYGAMWAPDNITFYVDGTPVWKTQTPTDMDQPLRMIVNLAVGGNWPGSPNASTPWPAEMKIDYVRTYALPPAGGAPTPPVVTPPPPAPLPTTGDQVLNSPYPGAALVGGAGNDVLNASQGSDRLTGGGGSDTFAFKAMPWSAGQITDFQAGVDKVSLAGLYTNGYGGSNPIANGYVTLASDGAGGTKVMLDTDAGGASSIKFHVTTVAGVAPGVLNDATLFGGSGAVPPSTPGTGGGQVLTSSYPGANLIGSGGHDVLNASQGSDRLTGGAGSDTFVFKAMPWSAGQITDFQLGSDKLDLSGLYGGGYKGSNPVADGYVSFVSDGMGGTKVLVDTDGAGSGNMIKFHVTTLVGVGPSGLTSANVLGGAGATPDPSPAAGVKLVATTPGSTLTGGPGADILLASQGADRLTGGGGADRFEFPAKPWSAGQITDFAPGSDILDLRSLFASAGYRGSNPVADGYLRLDHDGAGGTKVSFDQDGWGSGNPWPTTITTLNGVAPSSLHAGDWLFA